MQIVQGMGRMGGARGATMACMMGGARGMRGARMGPMI